MKQALPPPRPAPQTDCESNARTKAINAGKSELALHPMQKGEGEGPPRASRRLHAVQRRNTPEVKFSGGQRLNITLRGTRIQAMRPGCAAGPCAPAGSSSLEINQDSQLRGTGEDVSQSARRPMGGKLPEISAAVRCSSGPEGAPDPRR